jgi:hypothetical protein
MFGVAIALMAAIGLPIGVSGGGIPLRVEVGKTVSADVGNANGWFCDDPSLVSAEIVTRGDRNVWQVTGKKAGSTQCRVGTDISRASYVFDVTIVARRR